MSEQVYFDKKIKPNFHLQTHDTSLHILTFFVHKGKATSCCWSCSGRKSGAAETLNMDVLAEVTAQAFLTLPWTGSCLYLLSLQLLAFLAFLVTCERCSLTSHHLSAGNGIDFSFSVKCFSSLLEKTARSAYISPNCSLISFYF